MAQGDVQSTIVSVAGGATATVQPATGVTWRVESAGRANGTSSQVRLTDGTNTVTTSGGHRYNLTGFSGAFGATMSAMHDTANSWQQSHIQLPQQYIDPSFYLEFKNNNCTSVNYLVSAVQTN